MAYSTRINSFEVDVTITTVNDGCRLYSGSSKLMNTIAFFITCSVVTITSITIIAIIRNYDRLSVLFKMALKDP